jgi:enamine deaminase RidA (YjgF/YER057c/UK114 family)
VIERFSSGGRWEDVYGYSRVVRTGPWVLTAGCTSTVDGVVQHVGDPYAQALLAFQIALEAAGRYGVTVQDVARTRMFVVGRDSADAVGRAHGAVFRDLRPVSTLVLAAGLLDPDMLVEVEMEAYRP